MNPNREEALFAQALEKPVEKRAAFLDAMCEGDAALRQRLDALLAAHDAPDELSPNAKAAAVATMKIEFADAPDEAVGQTLGRYKLLEQVGEGGCGVVHVAEQTEPVRRRVALKVIKLGMDTKQVVARFEAERQALAMMDHPNIAKASVNLARARLSFTPDNLALRANVPGAHTNTLTFAGVPGFPYVVQYATNLSGSPWFTLSTNAPAPNGVGEAIDPAATNAQRFYRVGFQE